MKEVVDSVTLPQLETLLENLEKKIDSAGRPDQKARMYNLAGDMCFDAGQPERALSYYDKAITTYTACEQYPSAARICEKILAVSPESVRPYSTLAWLALKSGKNEEARRRISEYVVAAESHGLARLARQYLTSLAEVTEDRDVLESVAEGLMQLNDAKGADLIFGKMHA